MNPPYSNNDAYVSHVILTAQGGQYSYALNADRLRLIGDDIKAYTTGVNGTGIYFSNSSPQITNSVAIGSVYGVVIQNLYGYDGRLLPPPTFNGLVAEGQSVGFYNGYCYYNPRIRNSRITGTYRSVQTSGTHPGITTTYVSNSELNGPTEGYLDVGFNVCAGVTDSNGMFNSNSCP